MSVCMSDRPSFCLSTWNSSAPNVRIFVKFSDLLSLHMEQLGSKCTDFREIFRPSVSPHGTARLQMYGFSWNFILFFYWNLLTKYKNARSNEQGLNKFTTSRSFLLETKKKKGSHIRCTENRTHTQFQIIFPTKIVPVTPHLHKMRQGQANHKQSYIIR
jgi:hypothetical protein